MSVNAPYYTKTQVDSKIDPLKVDIEGLETTTNNLSQQVNNLELEVDGIADGTGGKSYPDLTTAMAVTPLPEDGIIFLIDPDNEEEAGKYRYDSSEPNGWKFLEDLGAKGKVAYNDLRAVSGGEVYESLIPINSVLLESINLFDKTTVLNGTYRSSTGIYVSDSALRAVPMMFLKAGQYTITGARTIFFGNIYNSNIPSAESRISVIKEAGSIYESTYTFNVPNVINGGAWVGLNITSAGVSNPDDYVDTYQIAQGTETTYHPYTGTGVDASKIIGQIPNVPTIEEVENIENKLNIISKNTYNLLDKSKVITGSYYNFSSGTISTNVNWQRILIKVAPNTTYTLSGINSIFVGWELDSDQTPIIKIGDNLTVLSSKTFTTGSNTQYVGLNIDSEGLDSSNTAMLTTGNDILPYVRYGVEIDGNIVANPSDVYYSFNGIDEFKIFMRYAKYSNYFVGYKVKYFNDNEIRADLWRIAGADEYIFDGENMNPTNVNIVTAAESEAVFLQQGKSDFTGGYHGDEIKTMVKFIANGVEITNLSNSIDLTKCNRFEYIQKSNMLETDNVSENIIAVHNKHTIFDNKAGYYTYNSFDWKAVINVQKAYISGISCIATSQANFVFSDKLDILTLNRDGDTKLNEVGYETLNFSGSSYGSVVSSKILKPSSYNEEAVLSVYDTSVYNKYYRAINDKNTVIGELWEGITVVEHFKK